MGEEVFLSTTDGKPMLKQDVVSGLDDGRPVIYRRLYARVSNTNCWILVACEEVKPAQQKS